MKEIFTTFTALATMRSVRLIDLCDFVSVLVGPELYFIFIHLMRISSLPLIKSEIIANVFVVSWFESRRKGCGHIVEICSNAK